MNGSTINVRIFNREVAVPIELLGRYIRSHDDLYFDAGKFEEGFTAAHPKHDSYDSKTFQNAVIDELVWETTRQREMAK